MRVRGLCVVRGATRVLHDVALEVAAGEIVTLIGTNGAGKTTTLMALSGLLPIASGSARLGDGTDAIDVGASDTRALVAAGLVHCPEGRQVFARLSIDENLVLGAWLERDRARVRARLERVRALFPVLGEQRRRAAGTLSGGEQMMLALGRALMAAPRVLLLDEPSLGLAPRVTETIFETLGTLAREERVALLVVEQNAMLALAHADRGYVLREGRVVRAAAAAELLADRTLLGAYLGGA